MLKKDVEKDAISASFFCKKIGLILIMSSYFFGSIINVGVVKTPTLFFCKNNALI